MYLHSQIGIILEIIQRVFYKYAKTQKWLQT